MRLWLRDQIWPVLSRSMTSFQQDDGLTLAAATAFYAALSFFPLLLVLLASFGVVLQVSEFAQNEQRALIDWITQTASKGLAEQIGDILSTVKVQATVSGPLGLLTLLLVAIGTFAQIDSAFDRIWSVPSTHSPTVLQFLRRVLVDRLKAFLLLLAFGTLILASFVLGIVLSTLARYGQVFPWAPLGWQAVRSASFVALNALLFALLYRILPRASVGWRDALAGGVLVAIVWDLGRQLLSLLVIGGKYSAYGVVGAFIAMMVWVYYASLILYDGAEIVKVLGQRRRELDREHAILEASRRN